VRKPESELVWQGRLQLGDEPGTFADACYAGLTTELPVTLRKVDADGADTTTLVVRALDVQTYPPYKGHPVTVTLYQGDGSKVLATTSLTASGKSAQDEVEIAIDLAGAPSPAFVGVRIEVDTTVPPGLYDDFVVTRLLHKSHESKFVASLGFRV
jgi:hypothetical protein